MPNTKCAICQEEFKGAKEYPFCAKHEQIGKWLQQVPDLDWSDCIIAPIRWIQDLGEEHLNHKKGNVVVGCPRCESLSVLADLNQSLRHPAVVAAMGAAKN